MSKKTSRQRRRLITHHSSLITLIVALAMMSSGCGARPRPNPERVFAGARGRKGKRPVIVIPGILGSRMVNRRTGEVVWPSAFRSSVDGLSLPATPELEANRDDLVASRIVETARLAKIAPEVYVYHYLLRALEDYGGHPRGGWGKPPRSGRQEPFFVFPYPLRSLNLQPPGPFPPPPPYL